jgi:tetratricopeptide (TPR) repeat protein
MTGSTELLPHPLSAIRAQRGWTLADVATLIQRRSGLNMACRREKVWRWEHGITPELPAQYALAAELCVDRDQVDAHPWPGWLLLAAGDELVAGPWTPQVAQDVLSRVVRSALMDRRGFLILSGTAAAGLALSWSTAEVGEFSATANGRVTPEVVDHLQARVEELWRLDDVLGGGSCLDAGVADLRLVDRLIRLGHYSPAIGRRLWTLAAALARFCGWAAFDAGHEAAAQRFWHSGLRAAAAAGDPDQGVYTLSNMALQAAYAGDGKTTVALLDVARRRVDPAARTVLAMLDTWTVRGLALTRQDKAVYARLNQADDLWDARVPGDDPDWVYWMPQPSLTAEAGTALLGIGDLEAAERSLTTGLATLDGDSARDRNLYLVRIAELQLREDRLDEAAETTRQALDASADIDSARVHARIAELLDRFPSREPITSELREYHRSTH